MQRRVEAANGDCISFKNGVDDANAIFGNPCPGLRKELRIKYVCLGNDVDMETESEELTTRGFQRNIIAHLNGELAVEVCYVNPPFYPQHTFDLVSWKSAYHCMRPPGPR